MKGLIAFVLSMLVFQHALKHDHQADVAKVKLMQERDKFLQEQMTRLHAEGATLLSVLQHWKFWIIPGALLVIAEFCWLVREMKISHGSCSEQDSSSSKEDEDDEGEEDLNGENAVLRTLAGSTSSPMQDLPDTCKVVKELVGDLLSVCQMLCKRSVMPQMYPAVGMDGYEAWSIHENSITYRLVVFLQPPCGHSFSLELDTMGQLPAIRVYVVLECTCWRKQLLGDVSCFLHQPGDKLPKDQSSYLLRTLCTNSYLDLEKIARWGQTLVRSAWMLLPQSHHCQLTVLPSSQSCKFKLTSSSKMNICMELIFAVQSDS
ncbi:PREDICTED: inositol 1,4,5-trisphosphate receptor-interacting protein-like 1 [Tauraco erythrolophus]|uniref:inositol 1,4,5-trisphosphate receptor-interacting protein-like 1 n=1 Tax=Tauraco erythrolophus TaxID=121530 RepID=UPI0005233872|nr:PREDICTED: inositol 1,4,5-trisphosphate receptor-interacting protein-like 1 [Tauraco erythrolophus]